MKSHAFRSLCCVAVVAAGVNLGFAASTAPAVARPLLDESRGVLTMAPVLEHATPAVVNISVQASAPGQGNPLLRDPFFRRFFGGPGAEAMPRRNVMAAGSGVVVDAAKGYIVTNAHVIQRADRITVTTRDGTQTEAKLLGSDPETDVALLQIPDATAALPLGDSDSLQIGDVVLAIGNPFGLGQTVTSGIVSALGRSGLNTDNYENFIQTDAPINPGNSGGALIDSKGQLVGINTAILAPSGGNVGIGFAIPVSMVKSVIDQIERYGEVRRGQIGVAIQTITPSIAKAMGLTDTMGVAITSVERNSPAERAGLRAGDVIVEIDGSEMRTASQVRNSVGLKEAGSTVRVTVLRNGQQQTIDVALERQQRADNRGESGGGMLQFGGATFASSGTGSNSQIVVATVPRGSAAWQMGLREGDVVTAVNQQPVRSLSDIRQALSNTGGSVAFNLRRGDMEILVFAS